MKVDPVGVQSTVHSPAPPQAEHKFTNEQKKSEIGREINMRQVVYPGQIRQGKLTQAKADEQIGILRAIWNDYSVRAQEDKERTQPPLNFGESAQPPLKPAEPAPVKPASPANAPKPPGDAPATPEAPKPAAPKTEAKGSAKA